jgi:hypothetical protein
METSYPWPDKLPPLAGQLTVTTPGFKATAKPSHYVSEIDPYDYAIANGLNFLEGNIIKYVTRWKKKDGVKDLLKAMDTLGRLIQHADSKGS